MNFLKVTGCCPLTGLYKGLRSYETLLRPYVHLWTQGEKHAVFTCIIHVNLLPTVVVVVVVGTKGVAILKATQ